MTIGTAIKELSKKDIDVSTFLICKVKSVDEQSRTCLVEPLSGQAELTARLQAKTKNTKGVLIVPAIGSDVIVTMINDETGFIAACTDINYIKINNDTVDLSTQIEKFIDVLDGTLSALMTLKVLTPVGPSIALTPDSLSSVIEQKTKLSSVKAQILTLIK